MREEGFGSPHPPFPENLKAAAEWIEMQSETDEVQWQRQGVSSLDAQREIERLADLAGLVAHTEARFVKYIRPDKAYRQMAGAFPGTFLDRLARETDRVAQKSAFRPEVLTSFVLTGLQPMISRVRITKRHGGCKLPGDTIPYRSVILEFNAADVSYDEVRTLYAEIREFFGIADKEGLSWHEFDFITLVDSMGGPPQQGKTRFWEDVRRRWKEKPTSQHLPLGSWRAARNKYERLDGRKSLRELITPNRPTFPEGLERAAEAGLRFRPLY